MLEDNLLKRRQELTRVHPRHSSPDDDEEQSGVVATTSTVLLEQKKTELEDRRQHLVQVTTELTDIEAKLEECRQAEELIKSELRAAKSELEKLKSEDMKNSKKLDEASELSENLMSKVCVIIGQDPSCVKMWASQLIALLWLPLQIL